MEKLVHQSRTLAKKPKYTHSSDGGMKEILLTKCGPILFE
jgi:hypothetical protein